MACSAVCMSRPVVARKAVAGPAGEYTAMKMRLVQ